MSYENLSFLQTGVFERIFISATDFPGEDTPSLQCFVYTSYFLFALTSTETLGFGWIWISGLLVAVWNVLG